MSDESPPIDRTIVPGNVCIVALWVGLLLLGMGCIVGETDGPLPVDSTSIVTLMTRAEQTHRSKHAAMLDSMAERAKAGEFKSMADEKKAFEAAVHDLQRASYETAETKHDAEAKPGGKYDGQASGDSLSRMAAGVRKAGK